jgi:hypothetical protein
VGELGEGFNIVEDSKMQAGSKSRFPSTRDNPYYRANTPI